MRWLTPANAPDDIQSKVGELRTAIDRRRAHASNTYDYQDIAESVSEAVAAGRALKSEWFYASVGIQCEGEDRETWYITKAVVKSHFATASVLGWTSWIGIWLRIRTD